MIIQAAVKREVKEESGFDFEPEALLCVECHAHSWVRFTLGGRIVGGALKTVAEGDRESLQAQWQPADKTELLQSVSDVCVCVCVCEIVGGNDSITSCQLCWEYTHTKVYHCIASCQRLISTLNVRSIVCIDCTRT